MLGNSMCSWSPERRRLFMANWPSLEDIVTMGKIPLMDAWENSRRSAEWMAHTLSLLMCKDNQTEIQDTTWSLSSCLWRLLKEPSSKQVMMQTLPSITRWETWWDTRRSLRLITMRCWWRSLRLMRSLQSWRVCFELVVNELVAN